MYLDSVWGNVIGSVTGKAQTGGGARSNKLSASVTLNVSITDKKSLLTGY